MSAAPLSYPSYIGKPAIEIWQALTEKALIDRYYMVPLLELELHPEGRISYGTDEAMVSGRIVEVIPGQKLVHTFSFAGLDDPISTVSYEIEPQGEAMALLTVTHADLLPESQTYANVSCGWPVIISSLKTMLETGEKLPWPKR